MVTLLEQLDIIDGSYYTVFSLAYQYITPSIFLEHSHTRIHILASLPLNKGNTRKNHFFPSTSQSSDT